MWISALLGIAAALPPSPRPGDLVFQESKSQQAVWLKTVTNSRYTHVGLVIDQEGELMVIEAVQPVQIVRLDAWIRRGIDAHVVVRRPLKPLTTAQVEALEEAASAHLGKPYDLAFSWDDEAIYCTELVAKAYQDALGWEVGTRRTIRSWGVEDPAVLSQMSARKMDFDALALAPVDLLSDPRFIDPALPDPK